ncbi:hypothetical protein BBJ28_00015110 [Nothophytophthora sp. Chile5]|nr:hypothetical protein BBJ28_00015110 [Nothophytophthora sp. Chile5]
MHLVPTHSGLEVMSLSAKEEVYASAEVAHSAASCTPHLAQGHGEVVTLAPLSMCVLLLNQVCIVDEDNNVVGKADRAVMDYCPGMLDPMTGGVVQFGEPMDLSAAREAEEEMGVKGVELRYLSTFYYGDERSRVWGGLFDCTFDGPLVLQEEEVAEVLEMSADEIVKRRDEFTPDGIFAFEKYLKLLEAEAEAGF